MKFRDLLTKINNAVRPVHVGDAQPAPNLLDQRVAGRAGNIGGTAVGGGPATDWVPSQQEEAK